MHQVAALLPSLRKGQVTHWFAHDSGKMLVRLDPKPGDSFLLGRGSSDWVRQPAFDEFRWCDPGMDWDEVDEAVGQQLADTFMAKS